MRKIRILNTDLVAATQEELLEGLRQGVVVTPNIDHLVKLQKDRELYELYQKTEWVICDSRLLYLFAKLLPQTIDIPCDNNPTNTLIIRNAIDIA